MLNSNIQECKIIKTNVLKRCIKNNKFKFEKNNKKTIEERFMCNQNRNKNEQINKMLTQANKQANLFNNVKKDRSVAQKKFQKSIDQYIEKFFKVHGVVKSIIDGIVKIKGLPNVAFGERVKFIVNEQMVLMYLVWYLILKNIMYTLLY